MYIVQHHPNLEMNEQNQSHAYPYTKEKENVGGGGGGVDDIKIKNQTIGIFWEHPLTEFDFFVQKSKKKIDKYTYDYGRKPIYTWWTMPE